MLSKIFRLRSLAFGLAGMGHLLLGAMLLAQTQPTPRLNYLSPLGAQVGASIEITVTGQDLEDTEGLYFSFPGVKVEPVGGSEKAKTPAEMKKGGGKPAQAQLSQKFKVTLPSNAPLGIHDVRIVTKGGVSNPRAFVIGDLKEVNEQEPNDDVPKAQKVELNTTINGLIPTGTDVDYFLFSGKKGQRVVVSCLSSSIDSKLPAMVQLYSTSGSYLAFSKGYQGNDALLDATLPADSDYYVRLCSFTYTLGGPDYFYRLTISTAPWIDSVFPPVVEAGKDTKVTLFGRNLPGGVLDPASVEENRVLEKATLAIKAPKEPQARHRLTFNGFVAPLMGSIDGFEVQVKNTVGSSNNFLVGFAQAPLALDNFDNDSPEKAQKVNVPCEIGGLLEKKGDRDYYAFTAQKGKPLSIEAFGDRLGSPVDLYFVILNDKGTAVTGELDDNPDITANQFYTRTEDPARYRFAPPADGEYKLMVTSRYAIVQAGPRQVYSVRITPEEPDFHVLAMGTSPVNPETVAVGQAGNQVYSVLVLRHGNFTGDVTLGGENLPPGVTIRPQIISANQKQGNLVVSAAPEAPPYTGAIKVLATAVVDGKKLVREVRGASITWPIAQAAPTISRLDREVVLAVRDKALYTLTAEKDKIDVPQGEKVTIKVKANRLSNTFKDPINVIALNLPPGMAQQQPVTLAAGTDTGTVVLDSKNTVLPGNFTLVLRGQTSPVAMKQNQNNKNPGPANNFQASGPVALTVVPKTLGKLSVASNNVKVPAGKETDVVIKIARLNEYTGPFKVEMVDAKGLTAKAATIPAGQDETKLTIQATGATPNSNPAVTIRATAMFNDTIPVVHETKLNLAITK